MTGPVTIKKKWTQPKGTQNIAMTRKKELQPLGTQQPQGSVIPLREYLGTGDEHQAAVKREKASTSGWRPAVPAFVIKT